jgi:hypothetical protein
MSFDDVHRRRHRRPRTYRQPIVNAKAVKTSPKITGRIPASAITPGQYGSAGAKATRSDAFAHAERSVGFWRRETNARARFRAARAGAGQAVPSKRQRV